MVPEENQVKEKKLETNLSCRVYIVVSRTPPSFVSQKICFKTLF